ncbi:MAG: leucyl aminopeptidase [Acidobacteria bacterium]|nr:leucyl aminopeptidase [Acidobacteriota bacterium]MCA1610570.1 leucyl aminopeptidase [Acidobacteriota bacterium]
MEIDIATEPPRGRSFSIALLHQGREPWARAPESVRTALRDACRGAGFRGREKETAFGAGWSLVGLGKTSASLGTVRRALRRALRDALRHSESRIVLALDGGLDLPRVRSVIREAAQGDYRFDRYKSKAVRRPSHARATVLRPDSIAAADLEAVLRDAPVLADVVRWARDLGNTPGNDLGPAEFARETRAMARRAGVTVRALGKREIERERMAGLLAVNSGSMRPPVFLIGEHRPARARGTVVLVGKGITFDSGGISIKPAASMGEMKYDMMGAATVFACLFAARRLALPLRVVALAPLTENLPSGSACRPGDILRMRNGKTVEVDNTDAEGRLVLADALSYAEKFRPDVLLDFATLTGAVLVALGHDCAGVMSPDDALAADLLAAGEETGERLWRLPVWDDYRSNLRSEFADMKNTGGRAAGTINAAVFLKEFVPAGTRWAHLDIAGVAHLEKEHAGYDAGATGFGVAMTLEFLRRRFSLESAAASPRARRRRGDGPAAG